MENNVNYNPQQQYVQTYNQQYVFPAAPKKKKKLPGPLVLFFTCLIWVAVMIPISLVTLSITSNTTDTLYYATSNISSTLIFFIIFSLLVVGGFIYSKNFKGSLKFLTSYIIPALIIPLIYNIIWGIAYYLHNYDHYLPGWIFDVLSIAYTYAPFFFSPLFLFFIEIPEKKALKRKIASPSIGNITPSPTAQGGRFPTASAIGVSSTTSISLLFCDLIREISLKKIDDLDSYMLSSMNSFLFVLEWSIAIIVLFTLAFLFTKNTKNGIYIIGCFGGAYLLSEMLNDSMFAILHLADTSPEVFERFRIIINSSTKLMYIVFTVIISLFLHKRKEFSEN